ncbi:threonine ammonia-lyase [Oscillospiraceae bacterium MB08-C2-2]|nr:threonine ammonia-lyase [Oscillospiraceae bacterium MB08-C2-2]
MELKKIEQAAQRLKGVIHQTPVNSSRTFSELSGAELYLKCENLQKTGSFKVRGAYNKIACLAEEGPIPPLIASSAGNHAQGVAYAATALGAQSTIVMPRSAPLAKAAATEGYGAKVVLSGECYDEAYQHALHLQEEQGAVFVHPFDDEAVIAGQGTISMEILQALPTVDAVLVPAGGGGLLAGMSACIKQINPRVKVIGVQAQGADALVQSFAACALRNSDNVATIADGIAVRNPGALTTELICRYVDEMVTVSDDEIAEAILLLLERTKLVVEPAGAASLAAAIGHKTDLAGKRVACVLSGGNIDVGFIHRVVEKGLVTRGRQMKFRTVMRDVPGSLSRFSDIMASSGANIIMVQHDRLNSNLQLGEAILHVACEVSGHEHGKALIKQLEANGYKIHRGS